MVQPLSGEALRGQLPGVWVESRIQDAVQPEALLLLIVCDGFASIRQARNPVGDNQSPVWRCMNSDELNRGYDVANDHLDRTATHLSLVVFASTMLLMLQTGSDSALKSLAVTSLVTLLAHYVSLILSYLGFVRDYQGQKEQSDQFFRWCLYVNRVVKIALCLQLAALMGAVAVYL